MLKQLTLSSLVSISQVRPPELWGHRQKRQAIADIGPIVMVHWTYCGPHARGCQPLPTFLENVKLACLFLVSNVLVEN